MKGILAGTVDSDVSSDYFSYRLIVELILSAVRLPSDCIPVLHIGRKVVSKDNKRGCRLLKPVEHGINIGINPGINYVDDGSHQFCYIELPGVNSEKVFGQLIERWGNQNFDPRPKEQRSPERPLKALTDKPRGEPFDPQFEKGKKGGTVEALPPGMAEGMLQVFNIGPSPVGSAAKHQTSRPGIYSGKGPDIFSPMGSCYLSPEEFAKRASKGGPKPEVAEVSSVPEERLLPPPVEKSVPLAKDEPPKGVVVTTTPPLPPTIPTPPVLTAPKSPEERKEGKMPRGNKKGSKHEKNRYTVVSQNPETFSKILSFAVHPIGAYELRKEVDKVMPWKGEVEDRRNVFAFTRFMRLQLLKKGYLEKAPDKQRLYIISEKGRKFISDHSGTTLPPAPPISPTQPSGENSAPEAAQVSSPPPTPQPPATTQVSEGEDWKRKYEELSGRYDSLRRLVDALLQVKTEIEGNQRRMDQVLAALVFRMQTS